MRYSIAFTTVLAAGAIASPAIQARQENNDNGVGDKFNSAADKLVSEYIPTSVYDSLSSPVMSAASAASVTGDFKDILPSALRESSVPGWLESAWPTKYSSQYMALTSGVGHLRGAATTASDQSDAEETAESATSSGSGKVDEIKASAKDAASDVKSKATDIASDVKSKATNVEDKVTSLAGEITGSEGAGARATAAVGGAMLGAMGLVMAL